MSGVRTISKDDFDVIHDLLRKDDSPNNIIVGDVPYENMAGFCTLPVPGQETPKSADAVYINDSSGHVYWQDSQNTSLYVVQLFKTKLTPEDIGEITGSDWIDSPWEDLAESNSWTEEDLIKLLEEPHYDEKLYAYIYAKGLEGESYSDTFRLRSAAYWLRLGQGQSTHFEAAKQVFSTLLQSMTRDEAQVGFLINDHTGIFYTLDYFIMSSDPTLQALGEQGFVTMARSLHPKVFNAAKWYAKGVCYTCESPLSSDDSNALVRLQSTGEAALFTMAQNGYLGAALFLILNGDDLKTPGAREVGYRGLDLAGQRNSSQGLLTTDTVQELIQFVSQPEHGQYLSIAYRFLRNIAESYRGDLEGVDNGPGAFDIAQALLTSKQDEDQRSGHELLLAILLSPDGLGDKWAWR